MIDQAGSSARGEKLSESGCVLKIKSINLLVE